MGKCRDYERGEQRQQEREERREEKEGWMDDKIESACEMGKKEHEWERPEQKRDQLISE